MNEMQQTTFTTGIKGFIRKEVYGMSACHKLATLRMLKGDIQFHRLVSGTRRDQAVQRLMDVVADSIYSEIRSILSNDEGVVQIFGSTILYALGYHTKVPKDLDLLVSRKHKSVLAAKYAEHIVVEGREAYVDSSFDVMSLQVDSKKYDIVFHQDDVNSLVARSKLDCCSMFWDGVDFWGTDRARMALLFKRNTFSIMHCLSPGKLRVYAHRLLRYSDKGFSVHIGEIWKAFFNESVMMTLNHMRTWDDSMKYPFPEDTLLIYAIDLLKLETSL